MKVDSVMKIKILLLALYLFTAILFSQNSTSARTFLNKKLTDAQWTSDLDSLVFFMQKTHPNLYSKTSRDEFDKQSTQIKASIPNLSDNEIITRFCHLVSMVKDGHTSFIGNRMAEKYFPIRIEQLSDGYFITAVSKKYADLFGAQVTRIGKYSSGDAFEKIGSVSSYDNQYSKIYNVTRQLTMSSLLTGLGIIDSPGILSVEILDKTNRLKIITIEATPYPFQNDPYSFWFWKYNAVPAADFINLRSQLADNLPLRLKNFEKPYWFEYIKEYRTVYFCFNSCENDTAEPFIDFINKLWQAVTIEKPEKLIIDLRNNLGGTNSYLQPLIHGIIRHDEINQVGHLFVLISRKTFSAALHCATGIERNASPIFVGEPTGAAPNHYADAAFYELPNSRLLVMVSTLFWQNGWPWDAREWIDPEIKVAVDSKEYFSGEDKALQNVFDFSRE